MFIFLPDVKAYLPENVVKILGPVLLAFGILGCLISLSFHEELGFGAFVTLALSGVSLLIGLSLILESLDRRFSNRSNKNQ